MTVSNQAALIESQAAVSENESTSPDEMDVKISLPETTMLVIGTSGLLWAFLFGAFNLFFG